MRVLERKFIATLLCLARNLLMHQSGKESVFFIKMWHSINLSGREDTGGLAAPLSGLSFQTSEQSVWIFHARLNQINLTHPLSQLPDFSTVISANGLC